jgi:hypothetical protein
VKRSYFPDRAASDAERQRRYQAKVKQQRQEALDAEAYAGLLSGQPPSGPLVLALEDAPPQALTRREKLAKASLGIEQFAGDWPKRFAQQRHALRISEEPEEWGEPADTWAVIEADDAPAQPTAESVALLAAQEDQLALKQARRKEREGSVPGAESRELLFKDGKKRRVRIAPAASGVRHIAITPELEAKALADLERAAARWRSRSGGWTPLYNLSRWNTSGSGDAFKHVEAISRAAVFQQTDFSAVTPDKDAPADVKADLLAERKQMVEETEQCLTERRARDPYADSHDAHRVDPARPPSGNAILLQPESDAEPATADAPGDWPERVPYNPAEEHAEALEEERKFVALMRSGINDPEVLLRALDPESKRRNARTRR